MNKLALAQLAGPFARDPAISLLHYIKDNWDAYVSGYDKPNSSMINFDTKITKILDNNIYIKEIINTDINQSLGRQRIRYTHIFSLQILCKGTSAINNRYLIEQHLDGLINGNATGLRADGIDEFSMTAFTTIPSVPDGDLTNLKADTKDATVIRRKCTVDLTYDKYQN